MHAWNFLYAILPFVHPSLVSPLLLAMHVAQLVVSYRPRTQLLLPSTKTACQF
jgi:hypothetical protein